MFPFKKIGVLVLILFTTLLVGVQTASACLCAYPGPTAADEFDASAAVGVFSIVSVEERAGRRDAEGGKLPVTTSTKIKFSAEKVYKGSLRSGEKIMLEQRGFTGCGFNFYRDKSGTRYLLYLRTDADGNKSWNVTPCSRSGEADDVAGDLLYLNNMEKRRGQTRLSGKVTQLFVTDPGGNTRREPVANSPVEIRGNGKTIRLETDRNGVFEVYGLAPGLYKITPAKIEGYDFAGSDRETYIEVEIVAGRQIERNFSFFSK